MPLDAAAKHAIRMNLEEALLRYKAYKRGDWIDPMLKPYLQMLDEIDAIGAYVSPLCKYDTREEYAVLNMYLEGFRPQEIMGAVRKEGVMRDQIDLWMYGDKERQGFIPAMLGEFLRMQRYCPFCDGPRSGKSTGASYPLNGTVCPHRELSLQDSEQDDNNFPP